MTSPDRRSVERGRRGPPARSAAPRRDGGGHEGLEQRAGGYWLQTFFVLILTTAFVSLGLIRVPWLTPVQQTSIIFVGGIALLALGEFTYRRWKDLYAKAFVTAGFSVLYTGIWSAAFSSHPALVPLEGFIELMVGVLVLEVVLAWRYDSDLILLWAFLVVPIFLVVLRERLIDEATLAGLLAAATIGQLLFAAVRRSATLALLCTVIATAWFEILSFSPEGPLFGLLIRPFASTVPLAAGAGIIGTTALIAGRFDGVRPFLDEFFPRLRTAWTVPLLAFLAFALVGVLGGASPGTPALGVALFAVAGLLWLSAYMRIRGASSRAAVAAPVACGAIGLALAQLPGVGNVPLTILSVPIPAAGLPAIVLLAGLLVHLLVAYRYLQDSLIGLGYLGGIAAAGIAGSTQPAIAAGFGVLLALLLIAVALRRRSADLGAVGVLLLVPQALAAVLVYPGSAWILLLPLAFVVLTAAPTLDVQDNFLTRLARRGGDRAFILLRYRMTSLTRLSLVLAPVVAMVVPLLSHDWRFVTVAFAASMLFAFFAQLRSPVREGPIILTGMFGIATPVAAFQTEAGAGILGAYLLLVALQLAGRKHAQDPLVASLAFAGLGVVAAMGKVTVPGYGIEILLVTVLATFAVGFYRVRRFENPLGPAMAGVIVLAAVIAVALQDIRGGLIFAGVILAMLAYFLHVDHRTFPYLPVYAAGLAVAGAAGIAGFAAIGAFREEAFGLGVLLLLILRMAVGTGRGESTVAGLSSLELAMACVAGLVAGGTFAYPGLAYAFLALVAVFAWDLGRRTPLAPPDDGTGNVRWPAFLALLVGLLLAGRIFEEVWGLRVVAAYPQLLELGAILVAAVAGLISRSSLWPTRRAAAYRTLLLLLLFGVVHPDLAFAAVLVPLAFLLSALDDRDPVTLAVSVIFLTLGLTLGASTLGFGPNPLVVPVVLPFILLFVAIGLASSTPDRAEPGAFVLSILGVAMMLLAPWAFGAGIETTMSWTVFGGLLAANGKRLDKRYLLYPGILYLILSAGKTFFVDFALHGAVTGTLEILVLGVMGVAVSYFIRRKAPEDTGARGPA